VRGLPSSDLHAAPDRVHVRETCLLGGGTVKQSTFTSDVRRLYCPFHSAASRISPSLQTTQPVGNPRAFFDSKAGKLLHRAQQTLGWPDGSEGVKASVQQSGFEGGNWSGLTGGLTDVETAGLDAAIQGGNTPGNDTVAQPGSDSTVQGVQQSEFPAVQQSGVELHVVDGRLIACRPGEPPPLSVREHTQAFLEWLRDHEKVPGVEVPVAILEHTLYWDFLYEVGLPMKPWRAVLATLSKMPGVEKYQADWRDTDVDAGTPVVVKIRRRRRAKVVKLTERREAS
jgi:hypothetical protein